MTPPSDDPSISWTVIACAVVTTALASLAVGLRLYVRVKLLRAMAREDWCIIAAWVFSVASNGVVIKEAEVALGHHMATVSAADIMTWFRASYALSIFYNLSLCFAKISILLLYLRVLTYDYVRKATYVTLGIVVLYNIWALGMQLTISVYYMTDLTWELTSIGSWSVAEINVAIICACLTTLGPILRKFFGPLLDRWFPHRHQSLEDGSNKPPLTIGSVPLKIPLKMVVARGDPTLDSAVTHVESGGANGSTLGAVKAGPESIILDELSDKTVTTRNTTTRPSTDIEAPPHAHLKR
ncbi:hypothetical protein B0H63DRAFT_520376 [Podospora didyma]|uniref:Rhodopsin domain-containing protein n=1 Tax=Podospora didyma TaxID=330526 RepID=A0AAE0P0S3_9PEZI|nr:hypothetical protein B0H63DRAFT_520376 [Podospora didyma]